MNRSLFLLASFASLALAASGLAADTGKKSVVLIAGRFSHGPGEHERPMPARSVAGQMSQGRGRRSRGRQSSPEVPKWPDAVELGKADTRSLDLCRRRRGPSGAPGRSLAAARHRDEARLRFCLPPLRGGDSRRERWTGVSEVDGRVFPRRIGQSIPSGRRNSRRSRNIRWQMA